jgi:hypothetical protein
MAVFECESVVKVFFAEQGTKAQLVATLERIAEEQRRRAAVDAEWASAYAGGRPSRRSPRYAATVAGQASMTEVTGTNRSSPLAKIQRLVPRAETRLTSSSREPSASARFTLDPSNLRSSRRFSTVIFVPFLASISSG